MAAALAGCDPTGAGRSSTPPPPPAPAPANAAPPAATGPIVVDILPAPAVADTPACDDMQGEPGECPSIGPADEGICANVIGKRCSELKAALKPRLAAQAVACLRALKGNERCDIQRINHCGHAALMSACPVPPRPQQGTFQPASGSQAASVTLLPDSAPDSSPVTAACNTILRSCGNAPGNPTLAECRLTLAGLNEVGRLDLVDCAITHCTSRGLYGCVGVPRATRAAAAAN